MPEALFWVQATPGDALIPNRSRDVRAHTARWIRRKRKREDQQARAARTDRESSTSSPFGSIPSDLKLAKSDRLEPSSESTGALTQDEAATSPAKNPSTSHTVAVRRRTPLGRLPALPSLRTPVSPIFGGLNKTTFDVDDHTTVANDLKYCVDVLMKPTLSDQEVWAWFANYMQSPLAFHGLKCTVHFHRRLLGLSDVERNRHLQLGLSHTGKLLKLVRDALNDLDNADIDTLLSAIVILWRVNRGDLVGAASSLGPPQLPRFWDTRAHLSRAYTLMPPAVPSRPGAWLRLPGRLPDSMLATLQQLKLVDCVMDAYAVDSGSRQAREKVYLELVGARNGMHHSLLSLPSWRDLVDVQRKGVLEVVYEMCRITVGIPV